MRSKKLGQQHRALRPLAELGIQPVAELSASENALAQWRCGRIVTEKGKLEAVYGRWWPYLGSLMTSWFEQKYRRFTSDRCELFYHAPLGSSSFLTLSYVRSGPQTSLSTFFAATLVLDEVARLRRSNAIVCQVNNERITDRLMDRWGWEPHCPHLSGRHFIKRFYGDYPNIPSIWRKRLTMSVLENDETRQHTFETLAPQEPSQSLQGFGDAPVNPPKVLNP